MDKKQGSIGFTSRVNRLPQIEEFGGSVAERHLENLKIMRCIGLKRFIDAAKELSPEETLIRRKIYSFHTGPG